VEIHFDEVVALLVLVVHSCRSCLRANIYVRVYLGLWNQAELNRILEACLFGRV
jgi:hypothetical protein